ncbi:hypothetical protein GBW32_28985 [Streptomyces tsukubensis]|uniref:Amidase n=2 Tax=Streptomyces tsukubensis TaxID=83656 RepID=A0A1V4ABI8_9ACTN|nr:hypothetical protein B1H18_12505 [Streptomyces tsukubensis]QFR98092.1 hypothetical protein GBW32_28985 [Streptomyces tsukubensis]
MPSTDLSPDDIARLAARAGLPLDASRAPAVAATVNAIHGVVGALGELRLGETAPASSFDAR